MTLSSRVLVLAVAALAVTVSGRRAAAQTRTPFQIGDRILLHVEGDSVLSDTFTVVAGPALRLPNIGDISLAGVPRADVEAHLTRELGRFIKDAVVQARALIRVSVVGEVMRPGYYAVPIDLVLADALMVAGGATKDAPAQFEGIRAPSRRPAVEGAPLLDHVAWRSLRRLGKS